MIPAQQEINQYKVQIGSSPQMSPRNIKDLLKMRVRYLFTHTSCSMQLRVSVIARAPVQGIRSLCRVWRCHTQVSKVTWVRNKVLHSSLGSTVFLLMNRASFRKEAREEELVSNIMEQWLELITHLWAMQAQSRNRTSSRDLPVETNIINPYLQTISQTPTTLQRIQTLASNSTSKATCPKNSCSNISPNLSKTIRNCSKTKKMSNFMPPSKFVKPILHLLF